MSPTQFLLPQTHTSFNTFMTDLQRDFADRRPPIPRKIPATQLLEARLIDDMAALPFQIQRVSDITKNAASRVSGVEGVAMADDETTFEQLQARIQKTIDYLKTVPEDSMDGKEDVEIVLKPPGREWRFTGKSYLTEFALPNFYFHVTTAYDLLRHKGVPLGKSDYLGDL